MTAPVVEVADSRLQQALGFLGELVLPSGMTLAQSWERDPWLRNDICIPALAKRPDGKPVNRYTWTELPKGAAKTTTGAALMLVEAAMEPSTHCYVLATDQEQAAIARFLDYVDRRIRRYIRAKRQLIALLNEQKQAIIHRAVTRGFVDQLPLNELWLPREVRGQEGWNVRLQPCAIGASGSGGSWPVVR